MKIYLVKTTDQAKKLGVVITDLGCIPPEDHEFLITEDRAEVLAGNNQFNAVFIKDAIPVGETFGFADADKMKTIELSIGEKDELVQEEVKPKKKAAKKKEDK